MNVSPALPRSRAARDHSSAMVDVPGSAIIRCLDDGRWTTFASRYPGSLAFQQVGWCRATVETFGYEPRIHIVEDSRGEIRAAWPSMLVRSRLTGNRLVCLPFCHRAGPLARTADELGELFERVTQDAKKLGVASVEVRDWPADVPVPSDVNRSDAYFTHLLNLADGPDEVFKGLNQNMRRSVRRAAKNGVTTRVDNSLRGLATFYKLYVDQRRRQRLLPQPEAFVRSVYKHLIEPGDGFIALAEHEGKPITALLTVGHGNRVIWTHSGATPEARTLLGSHAVLWQSVQEACGRGYTIFDFGRTDAPDTGLLHFKEQWGAGRQPLPYFYWGKASGVNTEVPGRFKRTVLDLYTRVTPDPIYKALSLPLYRELG